jgi:hypothetical protein
MTITELQKIQEKTIKSACNTGVGRESDLPAKGSTTKPRWHARFLCRVGIHRGTWQYRIDGNCGQLRMCRGCGITSLRTKHQRQWQYVKERSCEQVKTCLRCGEKGWKRIKHVWGPTYSVGSKDAHNCTRCKKHEEWSTYYDD